MTLLSWVKKIARGERILMTYTMDPATQIYDVNLVFARVSEAQAYGMGYQRGIKMLDELKYAPFKTYVRFVPDVSPEAPVYKDSDGGLVVCCETASTLYDHWRSDNLEKFLSGMITKKQLAPIDLKKLLMILIIAGAAAAGVALLVM